MLTERMNIVDAAAVAHEISSPVSWNRDAMQLVAKVGVREYCPSCYGHSCLKPIKHEEYNYSCARCESLVKRPVKLKPRGASVSETRIRRARSMEDGNDAFEEAKLCRIIAACSEPVRTWFYYSHTALDREKRTAFERKMFAFVVGDLAKRLPPMRLDESLQYFTLIGSIIESKSPGQPEVKKGQLAKMIGVERSQFYSGRRWDLIHSLIETVLDGLERTLTRALVEGMSCE